MLHLEKAYENLHLCVKMITKHVEESRGQIFCLIYPCQGRAERAVFEPFR